MKSKIKNIIIFVGIGIVLVVIFVLFLKPKPKEANILSSNSTSSNNLFPSKVVTVGDQGKNQVDIANSFLPILLSIKSINLDDSIFSDIAFASLKDSSIFLTIQPSSEGRVNPFAPIGVDSLIGNNLGTSTGFDILGNPLTNTQNNSSSVFIPPTSNSNNIR